VEAIRCHYEMTAPIFEAAFFNGLGRFWDVAVLRQENASVDGTVIAWMTARAVAVEASVLQDHPNIASLRSLFALGYRWARRRADAGQRLDFDSTSGQR
jgi:hypothetical protein